MSGQSLKSPLRRFVLLGGQFSLFSIWQYDATSGWSDDWPWLINGRYGHGCAAFGRVNNTDYDYQWIIVAGGSIHANTINYKKLSSTEIIDIANKKVVAGPEMAVARGWFHLFRVETSGVEAILALGGIVASGNVLDLVEELQIEEGRWVVREKMREARYGYGGTAVATSLIPCKCENFHYIIMKPSYSLLIN